MTRYSNNLRYSDIIPEMKKDRRRVCTTISGNAISSALFKPNHPFVENLRVMEDNAPPRLASLARLAQDISGEGDYGNLAELKSALELSIAIKTPSLAPLFEDQTPKDYGFSANTLLAWVDAMEKVRVIIF